MTSDRYEYRMRFRWQIALRWSPFSPTERAVLWALSTYCDQDGRTVRHPSYRELADAAGTPRRMTAVWTIRKAQPTWIGKQSRKQERRPAIYTLRIPADVEQRIEETLGHGALSAPSGVEDDRAHGALTAPSMERSALHKPYSPTTTRCAFCRKTNADGWSITRFGPVCGNHNPADAKYKRWAETMEARGGGA